jgi:PAS domain S-box-containing protein
MRQSFAYCKMHYDRDGNPADWTYLAVNDAFSTLTGLTSVLGRRISEVLPGLMERMPQLAETYGRVASGQGTERFEALFHPTDKWLEIVAFSPKPGHFAAIHTDITERKRAEETLRRIRFSVDHATDSVLWLNDAGVIVDASESTCRRLEYSKDELVGRSITDLDPALPAGSWPAHWETVKSQGALVFESIHKTKSGTALLEEITANYVNFDGQEYICSFSHDISKRREMEEALRFLQFSVNHVADSIIWTDSNAVIVEVSESACRNLEYSREELIGRSIFEIDPVFPPDTHPEHWRRIKESGSYTFETLHTTKSGRVFPTEITSNYIVYQGRECSCSFSRDITERKSAEKALHASVELLSKVLQAAPMLVVLASLVDHTLRDVNPAFEEISGYSRQEAIGRTPVELGLVDAEAWAALAEEFARDGRVRGHQVQARSKTGEIRHIIFYGEFIEFEGNPCLLAFIHDITERVRSEETMRDQQEQLRQSQKMEALGQLAGGVAHDFNNILTSILGLSELILASPDLPEAVVADVRDIRAAAERASGLTRQILAFSRRQALNPDVTCLNELLAGLERMLVRTLEEHITLETHLDPALGMVEVDVGQLEQVLLNLILNARDSMPEGGTLTLQTANVEIDEATRRDHPDLQTGRYVMLAVSDTGIGMDKQTMSRIFEPFFTTKPAGAGTGLGLSMVYGVVRQSGGAISVDSTPGLGTTFKIYLPRVDRTASAPPSRETVRGPLREHGTILILEDDDHVRSLVTRMLTNLGYDVTQTANGHQALAALATGQPFDLLLTDLVLPGELNGRQVAERALALRPGLPILYMSGYAKDLTVDPGRIGPNTNFLSKPFTTEDLAKKIRETLAASEANQSSAFE